MRSEAFTPCFCVVWALFDVLVIPAVGGAVLTSPNPDEVVSVFVINGQDAIFQCPFCAGSLDPSMVYEWSRVDQSTSVSLYIWRDGGELMKDKGKEYVSRTTLLDPALKLHHVTPKDSGKYRLFLRSQSGNQEAFVNLQVVQVSDVKLKLEVSSSSATLICESSGWYPEPAISWVDGQGKVLTAEIKSWSDKGSFNVRAAIGVTGNGSRTCRVGIPNTDLVKENSISVQAPLNLSGESCSSHDPFTSWFPPTLAVFILISGIILCLIPRQDFSSLRRRYSKLLPQCLCKQLLVSEDCHPLVQPDYCEYGDIFQINAAGASDATARAQQVPSGLNGKEASYELARRDLEAMKMYREAIVAVGDELSVHPALIAAIISRQSAAGRMLKVDGFGKFDSNSFGLMQVNKNYHALRGEPYSKEHMEVGVLVLIQATKTMRRMKSNWTREQQLMGALAAYISGEDRVINLEVGKVDTVTPCGDFANDVVARAHWFSREGFRGNVCVDCDSK